MIVARFKCRNPDGTSANAFGNGRMEEGSRCKGVQGSLKGDAARFETRCVPFVLSVSQVIEQPEPFVVSADWIVPIESEPIPNGLLVIAHGTLLLVGNHLPSEVRHFIGTDSRASNPDLNLWSEVKLVHANHPSVSSLEILKMITTSVAEFLGISDRYGLIRPGHPSTLTAIKLSEDCLSPNSTVEAERVYDALLASNTVSTPLEMVIAKGVLEAKGF